MTHGIRNLSTLTTQDRHATDDDRKIEALLADSHVPCRAQQLACALDWTLERTLQAIQRLDARIGNTGQTLQRHGHHTYLLAARDQLVHDHQRERCRRHANPPIDATTAHVLQRILTARRASRTSDRFTAPGEAEAVDQLLKAGLIEEQGAALQATPRAHATFGTGPPGRQPLEDLYRH